MLFLYEDHFWKIVSKSPTKLELQLDVYPSFETQFTVTLFTLLASTHLILLDACEKEEEFLFK